MKITAKDIRDFFKDNNYTPEELRDGDLAPYQMAEFLNSTTENERFLAEIKLNRSIAALQPLVEQYKLKPTMQSTAKILQDTIDEILSVKTRL